MIQNALQFDSMALTSVPYIRSLELYRNAQEVGAVRLYNLVGMPSNG